MSDNPTKNWFVWTYALRPGWENSGSCATRQEAREIRDDLIEVDGYPPEWVRILPEGFQPGRRPSSESIRSVEAALAAEDGG